VKSWTAFQGQTLGIFQRWRWIFSQAG